MRWERGGPEEAELAVCEGEEEAAGRDGSVKCERGDPEEAELAVYGGEDGGRSREGILSVGNGKKRIIPDGKSDGVRDLPKVLGVIM